MQAPKGPHPCFRVTLFDSLHPLRPPGRRVKRVWPEFDLMNNFPISNSGKGDRPAAHHAIRHVHIRDDLILFGDQPVNGELPASVSRIIFIEGGKMVAAADLLTRLGPLENIILMQEGGCCLEIVGLHGQPEPFDDLFALYAAHDVPPSNRAMCITKRTSSWISRSRLPNF